MNFYFHENHIEAEDYHNCVSVNRWRIVTRIKLLSRNRLVPQLSHVTEKRGIVVIVFAPQGDWSASRISYQEDDLLPYEMDLKEKAYCHTKCTSNRRHIAIQNISQRENILPYKMYLKDKMALCHTKCISKRRRHIATQNVPQREVGFTLC